MASKFSGQSRFFLQLKAKPNSSITAKTSFEYFARTKILWRREVAPPPGLRQAKKLKMEFLWYKKWYKSYFGLNFHLIINNKNI